MTTKQEIINKIQELANYHLGHNGLSFNSYLRLSKQKLEKRLATAEKMHEIDVQVKAIRQKYTDQEFLAAVVSNNPPSEIELHRQLCRQANDLWSKV